MTGYLKNIGRGPAGCAECGASVCAVCCPEAGTLFAIVSDVTVCGAFPATPSPNGAYILTLEEPPEPPGAGLRIWSGSHGPFLLRAICGAGAFTVSILGYAETYGVFSATRPGGSALEDPFPNALAAGDCLNAVAGVITMAHGGTLTLGEDEGEGG
ncbi:hypothetical protein DB346_14205 [Verrucomicrobia bacterium LW23]|nr:hypothetical protein DB346_14205 [Verrucomicrobia bacterium LW23]